MGGETEEDAVTEKELLQAVRDLARLRNWLVYHTHDSRRSEPGFPDLVLVKDRVLFVELKSERGKPTPAQNEWHVALWQAGATLFVWRPSDWLDGTIEKELM